LAGIYLHIPFCKQACHYCDFHFSTNLNRKRELVNSISKELAKRKSEVTEEITTIYFGGGTPSLLDQEELSLLMDTIYQEFRVITDPEITLEANPDDLDKNKLKGLKNAGINRLSIGIQTFDDERLKFINRAHTSIEAEKCLIDAKAAGFDNISADLIYAIPPDDMAYWETDLNKLLSYNLAHISLYGLTIEEKTAFGNWHKKGKLQEVTEDLAASQYRLAIDTLKANGYEHYEVSNFSKPGMYSRHNSAYWDDQQYLGVGPGAHSYNGQTRSFNISNNAKYITAIERNELPITIEKLSFTERVNEYIFTHLRTRKGISLTSFEKQFQKDLIRDYSVLIANYCNQNLLEIKSDILRLTSEGLMLADEISSRLFYDE